MGIVCLKNTTSAIVREYYKSNIKTFATRSHKVSRGLGTVASLLS